jgi:hypothetical protein
MPVDPQRTRQKDWFKSSYSSNANACVEVCFDRGVQVRDSKHPSGEPTLTFAGGQWAAFLDRLRP